MECSQGEGVNETQLSELEEANSLFYGCGN